MEWEEISRRLRNGTSVSVLAELAGTTYKNMYNRIRRREQLDGKQYLKPEQLKRPYKAQVGRKKAASVSEKIQARVKKGTVDITKYNCDTCANVIARPESYYSSIDGHVEIEKYCSKGHQYGGKNTVCSDYLTSALEPFVKPPEEKPSGQEVEPIGEEKAPARPEVVEKVAGVPEVVKDFAGIPEGVVKDTLEKYKKEQADAVREMHAIETMYKLQKAKEMKLRTVVLALERLLEGGSL